VAIGRHEGTPAGARLGRLHLGLQAVLGSLALAAGVASLAGAGPFAPGWIAAKVALFGLIFACGIGIDHAFRPIVPAFGRLAAEGSTPAIEAEITGAIDGAVHWVLALYALLLAIAFLGTVQPSLP
jgi:hypothetical protein